MNSVNCSQPQSMTGSLLTDPWYFGTAYKLMSLNRQHLSSQKQALLFLFFSMRSEQCSKMHSRSIWKSLNIKKSVVPIAPF